MAERPGTRMPVILDVDDPPVLRAVERDLSRRYARQYRGIRTKPGEAPVDALGRLKYSEVPSEYFYPGRGVVLRLPLYGSTRHKGLSHATRCPGDYGGRAKERTMQQCTHLDQINEVEPSAEGCEECLRMGDVWVHLRECLTCGHVGCCDSSKNKHATKHFQSTTHPIVRSFQPGEDWRWCYIDEVLT